MKESYRKILMSAHGEGTSAPEEVLRLTMEFERYHGSVKRAILAGQDMLAVEESLSGTTSEPYLRASETLANLYQQDGDHGRAVSLLRQNVAIGDLVFPARDEQRGTTRMNLALALARHKQFDEAERWANEAVAAASSARPSQPNRFIGQVEQIRRMKTAAAPPESK